MSSTAPPSRCATVLVVAAGSTTRDSPSVRSKCAVPHSTPARPRSGPPRGSDPPRRIRGTPAHPPTANSPVPAGSAICERRRARSAMGSSRWSGRQLGSECSAGLYCMSLLVVVQRVRLEKSSGSECLEGGRGGRDAAVMFPRASVSLPRNLRNDPRTGRLGARGCAERNEGTETESRNPNRGRCFVRSWDGETPLANEELRKRNGAKSRRRVSTVVITRKRKGTHHSTIL